MRKMMNALALGAGLLGLAVVGLSGPARAVSISKTNWAEGDPAAARAPRPTHTAAPADTTGEKRFDKSHENGTFAR